MGTPQGDIYYTPPLWLIVGALPVLLGATDGHSLGAGTAGLGGGPLVVIPCYAPACVSNPLAQS